MRPSTSQPTGTGAEQVLAQAYQLAEAGASMSSIFGRRYRLTSRISTIGLRNTTANPTPNPQPIATGGLGYAFSISPTKGQLAWLTLYTSRHIGLPYLPHQPTLAYLTSPFSVNLERVALQTTATESVGATFRPNFSKAGLRLRGNINYRYRIREVSGLYNLNQRARRWSTTLAKDEHQACFAISTPTLPVSVCARLAPSASHTPTLEHNPIWLKLQMTSAHNTFRLKVCSTYRG